MLRVLLVLSRWNRGTVELRSASRTDDVVRHSQTDEVLGLNWHEVVASPRGAEARSEARAEGRSYAWDPRELIKFQDLELEGLSRWFDLSETYRRVLDPVVSQALVSVASPLARLSETGPAIEALGYFLLRADGLAEDRAARVYLKARTERVVAELDGLLPFDGQEWAETMPDIYNAIKHANRAEPAPVDVMNAWGRSVMVVRAWAALELGVDRQAVKERLGYDRQPYMFVGREAV